MKVYITFDKSFHEIICVHQYPNTECPICKPIRELKDRNVENNIVEIEMSVYNNAKTYDSPAILGFYENCNCENCHCEENICCADEEDMSGDIVNMLADKIYYYPETKKTEKLFDEKNIKTNDKKI